MTKYTDDIVIENDIMLYPAGVVYDANIIATYEDKTVDLEFERDGQIIKKYNVSYSSDRFVGFYYD